MPGLNVSSSELFPKAWTIFLQYMQCSDAWNQLDCHTHLQSLNCTDSYAVVGLLQMEEFWDMA